MVVADFGLARWSRPEEERVYKVSSFEQTADSSHDSGDSGKNENSKFEFRHTRSRSRTKSLKNQSSKLKCVGSPFWMAPEMLAGDDYDNRVDIFSYGNYDLLKSSNHFETTNPLGIVLCEVIGRVDPDPDYLPRTTSFGLAVAQYYVQYALKHKCPEYFFAIAVTVSIMRLVTVNESFALFSVVK